MKKQAAERLCESIHDLTARLKNERDKHKELVYEASVTETLKEISKDEDERCDWALEKSMLDSMLQVCEQETDQLIDELAKKARKLASLS